MRAQQSTFFTFLPTDCVISHRLTISEVLAGQSWGYARGTGEEMVLMQHIIGRPWVTLSHGMGWLEAVTTLACPPVKVWMIRVIACVSETNSVCAVTCSGGRGRLLGNNDPCS